MPTSNDMLREDFLTASPPAALQPDRLMQLLASATEHEKAGRLDAAEAVLNEALAAAPQHARALHKAGIVAYRQGRIADAAALMERSIVRATTNSVYQRNICEVYRVLGRYEEALSAGRRAIALDPNDPKAHDNLGLLHYHRLELDKAIASTDRALALDPGFSGAHYHKAEALLLRGEFAAGWEEYEWRLKLANAPRLMPPTDRPQWEGEPLRDGTLLLIADQGYGDVIQFSRFIPWAAARCRAIALACSSDMRAVVAQLPGIALIFDHWGKCPAFAAFCSLSRLPRLAGTRLHTIPAKIPYLRPDPRQAARWAERLAASTPKGYRRIGIAWAGRPTHTNDHNRSIALSLLAPLAELPKTALFSLQKGSGQDQTGSYRGRAPLISLGSEIRDFADTMAILDSLDLVITVDTSLAHLAGAMGKQAWILLPFAPDWRWLLDRSDSPWYPTLRLFRQPVPKAWTPLIHTVAAAL